MADAKKLMKNAGLQMSLLCDALNEWPGKSRPIPEVTVRKWIGDFSQGKGVGGFNGSKIEKAFSFLFSSSPDTPELLVRFAALDTKLIRLLTKSSKHITALYAKLRTLSNNSVNMSKPGRAK